MFDYLTAFRWNQLRRGNSRTLTGAAELIGGKQCIHRTRAETLQIEGDELESKLLEDRGELRGHRWIQSPLQFLAANLDADDVAVVPYAKLTESQGADGILTALDDVERLPRNRASIFDSGRKACRCRL